MWVQYFSILAFLFITPSLSYLSQVVGLLDVFTPATSLENFQELYLVTHLMGADLNNIIRQQALTDEHVQFLVYQILRGLKVCAVSALSHTHTH